MRVDAGSLTAGIICQYMTSYSYDSKTFIFFYLLNPKNRFHLESFYSYKVYKLVYWCRIDLFNQNAVRGFRG